MVKSYEPKQGDIVWVNFDKTKGHEQKGKRPALVISKSAYNKKVGLALMCPITSNEKGYPFEVKLKSTKVSGVVLADQVRTLDWKERKIEFAEKPSSGVIKKVIEKITLLLDEN